MRAWLEAIYTFESISSSPSSPLSSAVTSRNKGLWRLTPANLSTPVSKHIIRLEAVNDFSYSMSLEKRWPNWWFMAMEYGKMDFGSMDSGLMASGSTSDAADSGVTILCSWVRSYSHNDAKTAFLLLHGPEGYKYNCYKCWLILSKIAAAVSRGNVQTSVTCLSSPNLD